MQPKLPPHSIEAEQAVIGGLLISPDAYVDIGGIVTADDFYREDHRLMFTAIHDLAESAKPFDVVTVTEKLRAMGRADLLGYLGNLAADTPSAANIRAHAEVVQERAAMRGLIREATKVMEMGFDPSGDPWAKLDEAEKLIGSIRQDRSSEGLVTLDGAMRQVIESLERAMENDGGLVGLSTGFVDLDRLTLGLEPGSLNFIAARPSMGKSALASVLSFEAARSGHVLMFTMEMSAESIVRRSIAHYSGVSLQKLRSGRDMQDEDWSRMTNSASAIRSGSAITFDETGGITSGHIKAKARRVHRKNPLSLMVVDYLQLMSGDGGQNRNSEIEKISRDMKALAKELRIPVVALSQLNRKCEERADKRPMMSDLRDSGAIEQDADQIWFIYRDEVYNKDSNRAGIAEIIVGKNRNGPCQTVPLVWHGETTSFRNYSGPPLHQLETPFAKKNSKGMDY